MGDAGRCRRLNRITLLRGGESCCARWSPNGERTAFQSYPGDNVFVYEPTTGKRRVVGSIAAFFDLVDWLDDQTLLVVK